jgi:putative CocE/NonD family hydrolase
MRRLGGLLLLAMAALAPPGARAQQPAPLGTCRAPASNVEAEPQRTSVYVPMPDGVRLAVDVFLPKALPAGARLPTIFVSTRYWRAREGQPPGAAERFWLARGYAYVHADVRGTGASFGQWYYPWSPQEVKDLAGLVAWIATQPWSDGTAGAIGTSYTGNTAQLVAASTHPAVKAVVPRFMDFDVFADLTYPGGMINRFIIHDWGKMVHAMDLNQKSGDPPRGVRPVDADRDGTLLRAAVKDHERNPPLDQTIDDVTFRDDVVRQFGNVSNDVMGTYRYRDPIERSGVPVFGWASWLDAGTAQGVVNRFLNWTSPQISVIGAWSHGGGHHASPFLPPDHPTDPPSAVQAEQAACFLDQFIKGKANGMGERALIYYTMVEDRWKKTSTWPIPGTRMVRWYLDQGNGLSRSAPTAATGSDRYRVDFDVTTGTQNRWYTQLGGGDVVYAERSEMDRRLLTYTSAPLDADLEVTGHGQVTLHVTSTASDGNFFVYLENVAPDGQVTYVTEALLRAVHRKLSTDPPPYRTAYPYRSFLRKDAQPLEPGQPATLSFPFLPTSVLFRRGHRIRIAIAGADQDTFLRIPADGEVTISVSRGSSRPSFVELPVVPRG